MKAVRMNIKGIRAPVVLVVVAIALVTALTVPVAKAQMGLTTSATDTRPEFVIAVLGDSYASGEGAPDVHGRHSAGGDLFALECIPGPGCFSETWWKPDSWFSNRLAVFPQQDDLGWQADTRRCHRSSKGPGVTAAMTIAQRFPDVKITVLDFACSGSKITDGLLLGWAGSEPPSGTANLPSQIAALESYVSGTSRHVDAIIMNIGGNDAKFADIVVQCIINVLNNCANDPLMVDIGNLVTDASSPRFPNPNAPLSERFKILDAAIRDVSRPSGVAGLRAARPDEIYLTALPNPSHGAPSDEKSVANPEDYCDGTQSDDFWYKNASFAEAVVIENIVSGMNGAMQRAANRYGWIFLPELFDLARDHGICANAASYFRANDDALRIQGDEGLSIMDVTPSGVFISPGIAHQNEAGYMARAKVIAIVVGEQVRMRFRAPNLFLDRVEVGTSSKVKFRWHDPSPLHLPETKWELEVVKRGALTPSRVLSDDPDTLNGELTELPSPNGRTLWWRITENGEFTARVRGCRASKTGFYCGPFSDPVNVVTYIPDTPVNLMKIQIPPFRSSRVMLQAGMLQVGWTPGPRTPSSVLYEVANGPYGPLPCPSPLPSPSACGFGMISPTISSTTSTRYLTKSHAPSRDVFQVRACSTAGCSPYSPAIVIEDVRILLPTPPPDIRQIRPTLPP